jgi:hypothetical protein
MRHAMIGGTRQQGYEQPADEMSFLLWQLEVPDVLAMVCAPEIFFSPP